jgi:hypothetical protein
MSVPAKYEATAVLLESTARHGISFAALVAETGLWTAPEVHRQLLTENGTGAYYPHVRRARAGQGEKVGGKIGPIYLDSNNYANTAIKQALGVKTVGFETCHIWPLTCYDERYHTAIANLVLLPRALAGLSDHDPAILAMLQYRAYELYSWHPRDKATPTKPVDYPTSWRAPFPFTAAIARTLRRRRSRPTVSTYETIE